MALPALLSGGSKMISSGSKLVKTANISEKFLNIKSKKTTGENFGDKKPAAIVTQKSSSIIPSFPPQQVKGKTIGTQTFSKTTSGGGKGTLEEDVRYIKDKVIEIDKLLKGSFSQRKKEEERLAKQSSDVERKKKEEKIEKGAGAGIMKGMGERAKKPFSNIFEGIKNYITAVLLGFVINKLAPLLPKLLEILPILAAAMEGVLNFAGFLLDGFVTFIDWGYQAYDATRGFIEKLGGENAVKAFDKFSEIFNQAMNLALIVAMASAAGGGPGGKPGAGFRPKPGTGGRPKVTTTGGRGAGRPDLRNPLRDRPKVTTTGGGTTGRPDLRNPLRQRPQITGASPSRMLPGAVGELGEQGLKKSTGKFLRPLVKRLPVVGGLVDFAIAVALGESLGRAAFRSIGATLLGGVGAAAGSVVPGAGTFLGGLAGGFAGDAVGGVLYDMIFANKKPKPKSSSTKTNKQKLEEKRPWWDKFGVFGGASAQMKKKEGGGVIETPSYVLGGLLGKASAGLGSIGMIKLPPIPKFNLPKLTPTSIGDAISGGIQKLFSFFGIGGEAKKTEPPSYIEGLINLANKVKDVPLIGGSMFAAIQLALGMKVDRNVLSAVGGQLVNFSNLDAFKGITSSISKLSSALKFEKGGLVTSTVVSLAPSDNKKSVVSLSNYLDNEIKSIELELEEEKESAGQEDGGPGGGGGGGDPGGTDPGTPSGPGSASGANLSKLQKQALNILAKYESQSAGNYNAVNQGGAKGGTVALGYSGDYRKAKFNKQGRPLTDLTIKEIMNLQYDDGKMSDAEFQRAGKLHAVGRYQFIGMTLPGVVKRAKIPTSAKFSPDVQDLLGMQYLKEAGIGAWVGPSRYASPAEKSIVAQARKEPIDYRIQVTRAPAPKPKDGGGFFGGVAKLFGGGGESESATPSGAIPKGSVLQWLHGTPGRKGYDVYHAGQDNAHDHFGFRSRQSAVNAFKKLKASGYKPYEFEGYGRKMPRDSHSPSGGHFGPVGGKPTYDDLTDGTAFDIPWSSYGSGPIGPKDYALSLKAAKIVGAAQGGGPIPGSYKGLQQTMSYDNMQTQTLIQPVIVERQVPVPMPMPMGGGTKVMVAGGVNSNNDLFAG